MTRLRLAATALALCGAAACSKSDSGGTGPATTGTLDITITAPVGVTPSVSVVAPTGAITTITSSQTLTALPAGSYTVIAQPGVTTDPIVGIGYAGTVTGSPAAVPAGGGASATVTYTTPWAALGHVWVSSTSNSVIQGFTSAQLSATGTPTAAVKLGNGGPTSSVKAPGAMAVDARGGLWYVTNTDTLRYFTAAHITSTTNAAPDVRLVAPSIMSATSLAIDVAGNLWVADQFGNTISEFTAAQLTVSGTVTPAVVISAVVGTIQRPWGVTFDAKGDLWVVNYYGNSIVGYSPAQIAVSGAPVPAYGISGSKGATAPLGAAFDAQGNLWVVSIVDTLAKYNAADLNALGSPTPSVIITGSALQAPIGIALDESGAVWVSNYVKNTIIRYDASQLTTTGSPAPAAVITLGSGSTQGDGIVFSPRAKNLPVH